MSRKTKHASKYEQAVGIVAVHTNCSYAKIRRIDRDDLYRMVAKAGYYWNVAQKDWQHIRLTLTHIQSAGSIFGKDSSKLVKEYLKRLSDGGIIVKTGKENFRRTTKIELPAKHGGFKYGR